MIRSPRSSRSRTYWAASPVSATSSSILRTRVGAPPCSGPESEPTAADIAAAQSAPVEATMRAVKVDALSAVLGGRDPVGVDRLAHAAGRPRLASARRKRSAAVSRPRDLSSGDAVAPSPRRGLGDDRDHRGREPREIVARLRCRSMSIELLQAPLAASARGRGLEVGHRAAGRRRRARRLGARHPGLEARRRRAGPRPSRTGTWPTSSSMSTPR